MRHLRHHRVGEIFCDLYVLTAAGIRLSVAVCPCGSGNSAGMSGDDGAGIGGCHRRLPNSSPYGLWSSNSGKARLSPSLLGVNPTARIWVGIAEDCRQSVQSVAPDADIPLGLDIECMPSRLGGSQRQGGYRRTMRKSFSFRRLAVCFALLHLASTASALEISVSYTDNRPLFPPALWVQLNGEIETGDTERLRSAVQPYLGKEISEAVFTFDSGGGSLAEGLRLGEFIADMPFITLGQVGGPSHADGICASACVLSYLGADYRYLQGKSQIGVHRFGAPGSDLDSDTTMAIAQEISGSIISHIREMRADPELYELMASTDFTEIAWIPLAELERLRVVTNNIFSESFEYQNINGGLALHIEQIARYGENSLFLICGDKGLVGVADLNKPEETPPLSGISISIDEIPYQLADWQIIENSQWRLKTLFSVPPSAASELVRVGKIGVQALQPVGTFFGFSGEPTSEKISEMAASCTVVVPPSTSNLDLFYDTDINGGDLTVNGYRPTTLSQCEDICRSSGRCVAFSFILDKGWCWPKGGVASTATRSGVVSAWVR